MFPKSVTLFVAVFLLFTCFTNAVDPDCRMMTPGENPYIADVEDLIVKLLAVCHRAPPRLPPMSTSCHSDYTYRSAVIRICPPKTLSRQLWSTPVVYRCHDVAAIAGNILGKCRTVIATGGIQPFDDPRYGVLVVTRPGGPNPGIAESEEA